jgi:predicted dehydrogenase
MGANHARVLAELQDAELVAVADISDTRLERGAHGARTYRGHLELLEQELLEAVTIAVPTRKHSEIALEAIRRGLPLLVEKPLAANLDECLEMRRAAEANGVHLMVGHVERFNPVVQALKERLASDGFSGPYEIAICRVGPFFERERDVGVVHDLATHDIDILRWLLGAEVEHVSATIETGLRTPHEDALRAELHFEGGHVATLEVNWLAPVKKRQITVSTSAAGITVDAIRQELRATRGSPAVGEADGLETFPGAGEAPLRGELETFVSAVRGNVPPPVSADDAIAAMRVVEALIESGKHGRSVRLIAESAHR